MKEFARNLPLAAILADLCCGAAMATDLSTVGQWTNKYPFDKIAGGKSLWDQPGVEAAMRAAMGKRFFALLQKEMHGPEAPVASNGKGRFAAWSCKSHDCGKNQMTVFVDSTSGSAQVCWRSSAGISGEAQDLWLADGKPRPLPANACGYAANDPFAALTQFGGAR